MNLKKMKKYYAGVGSRKTPFWALCIMSKIANELEIIGYTLRSGGAKGADKAFESGVVSLKEIYYAFDANAESILLAKKYHPAPNVLSEYALNLMARNSFQVLGKDLKTPVDFLICWTPDGCESRNKRTIRTGGTGQAISIASDNNISIINLKNSNWSERLEGLTGIKL